MSGKQFFDRRLLYRQLLIVASAFLLLPIPLAHAQSTPGAQLLSLAQLRARYRLPDSQFVTLRGAEVHYTDGGKGPVIVLIHGSNGSLRTYDKVVVRLRRHYRVIRYDQASMGLSGSAPAALQAQPLYPVLILKDLLDRLGVRSATLVGVSGGGALAFYFAGQHPDRVDRLILSNTPIGRADGAGMMMSKDLARESSATKGRFSGIYRPRSFWKAFFTFYTGEPERMTPPLLEQYYDMNRRIREPDRLAIVEALEDTASTRATLASIAGPVALVWGARDPILPPASANALEAALTTARVSKLILPDVGHFPPLEVPERFAAIIADFIAAVTPIKPKAPPPAER